MKMELVKYENNEDRSPSPNSACAICLGQLLNISRPSACRHSFCFACLLQWSRVKYECPLCKTPFLSIVRTEGDEHLLPARHSDGELVLVTADTVTRLYLSSIIQFRRYIYVHQHRATINTRTVFCPNLFRVQPLQCARLRPWLLREMTVLLPRRCTAASEAIIYALQRCSLDDDEFAGLVNSLVTNNSTASHFRHELRLFSASYYDMHGWDMNAQYLISPHPNIRPVQILPEPNDVEILEIRPVDRRQEVQQIQPISQNVEIITVSDSENVEVIDIDSDHGDIIIVEPMLCMGRIAPAPVPSASQSREGPSPRRKRRKHESRRSRTRQRIEVASDIESQTDNDESYRHRKSRSKRDRSRSRKSKDKRSHKRRSPRRRSPSDDSSDTDYLPARRHRSSERYPRRSVIVAP